MIVTLSRRLQPISNEFNSRSPSLAGIPSESWNSDGAAPVPPSPPSTVMKSGVIPVSSIAWHSAASSDGWPTQSLKPTGFPPASSRRRATKRMSPEGV
eukprot:scaffold34822_cov32-Tisochrysis_lutea.AAC.4